MPLLSVENLYVSYGSIEVLHGVSLGVNEGEMVAVLGVNGAGKTTLLRTISGILKPTQGEIKFMKGITVASIGWIPKSRDISLSVQKLDSDLNEERLSEVPPHKIVKKGVAQVREGRGIIPTMTVWQNLQMGAYSRNDGDIHRDIEKHFERFPILKERRNHRAEMLSGGEQQILVIVRALMAEPKLLLVDEASLGLAPLLVREVFQILKELNQEGMTILLVEQNAREALRIADRGYVLENGNIALQGTSQELSADEGVKKAYLGR